MVTRRGDEVLYDGEPVDSCRGHLYGLAIDLGTTTVVMQLIDLETGATVSVSSFENPQRFGGSDVMHRISYDGGEFRGELQRSLANAISHEILELGRRLGFARQEIYEIVVAGNSDDARPAVQARRAEHRPEAVQVADRARLPRGQPADHRPGRRRPAASDCGQTFAPGSTACR